uniref:Pyrin domain-containing protein n=1 Tax=Astatotilapia calliptera TaxID=8154 RepID=A0A3P8Q847_ASTCA
MTEPDLVNILEDITDEEFKTFKWNLKNERFRDIEPIKVNRLSTAERCDAVDLMVQKYDVDGAVQVMESIFKKINRNDLVKKLRKVMGQPAGLPGPDLPKTAADSSAEEKLAAVRSQFIDRVSEPVLMKLLDKLLERRVIIDDEMDLGGVGSRADKARQVIGVVRRKGSQGSSALIAALCEVDPCLSRELQLM